MFSIKLWIGLALCLAAVPAFSITNDEIATALTQISNDLKTSNSEFRAQLQTQQALLDKQQTLLTQQQQLLQKQQTMLDGQQTMLQQQAQKLQAVAIASQGGTTQLQSLKNSLTDFETVLNSRLSHDESAISLNRYLTFGAVVVGLGAILLHFLK